jgi:rare lipoprotein A
MFAAGCSSHKTAQAPVPAAPPPIQQSQKPTEAGVMGSTPSTSSSTSPSSGSAAKSTVSKDEQAFHVNPNAKPIQVETGMASWYGPPYNKRRGSNGEIYNMNALTAAHRTLPLGTVARVTNQNTGHWTLVRITDRGPFVNGRVLDLSLAAAKKIDVWREGLAPVRVEVLYAPSSLNSGGKWAVQIGGFEKQGSAEKFAGHLSHRYTTAKVLTFGSPVGDWWVRVRVQDDDKKRAEEVARDTRTHEGGIFLVRLD